MSVSLLSTLVGLVTLRESKDESIAGKSKGILGRSTDSDSYNGGMLTSLTKPLNIKPIVLLSRDVANEEYSSDLQETLHVMFSAQYLQAFSLVANVQDVRILDSIKSLSTESVYQKNTGTFHKYKISKESIDRDSDEDSNNNKYSSSINSFDVEKSGSLSIGRLLEVKLLVPEAKNDLSLYVNIILSTYIVTDSVMRNGFELNGGADTAALSRWTRFFGGELRFVKDIVLGRDIINKHGKAMIEDRDGVLAIINKRARKIEKSKILSNKTNHSALSNIFVITKEEADSYRSMFGGDISSNSVRKNVFKGTYAMMIVVVDRDRDEVTFYYNDNDASNTLRVKDLKKVAKKKSGDDVMEVFKTMMSGSML